MSAISQRTLHQSQSNSYIEDLTAADMSRLKSGDKVVVTITDEYELYASLVVANA